MRRCRGAGSGHLSCVCKSRGSSGHFVTARILPAKLAIRCSPPLIPPSPRNPSPRNPSARNPSAVLVCVLNSTTDSRGASGDLILLLFLNPSWSCAILRSSCSDLTVSSKLNPCCSPFCIHESSSSTYVTVHPHAIRLAPPGGHQGSYILAHKFKSFNSSSENWGSAFSRSSVANASVMMWCWTLPCTFGASTCVRPVGVVSTAYAERSHSYTATSGS
ncbi:hypothetical protein SCHPADRAFT_83964 [Schizopora paradoxa]|uniref:Uncharacterized protein n=1 Tax=Schizopora paradoxa TaxID=27342 RepID=A0A0H2S4W0_9AGAM|nr:hypothetical protein SCHPADRAFT_83964 [Schizopora paradoxa]